MTLFVKAELIFYQMAQVWKMQVFYTVELNPINGCTDIYQVNLYQRPAPVSIVNDTFCQGTTYILPNGTSVNVAGNYPVTISTPQGCDSLVTTQLYMRPAPNLTLGADKTICEGTNTTFSAQMVLLAIFGMAIQTKIKVFLWLLKWGSIGCKLKIPRVAGQVLRLKL